jgi:hypothetical protein
MRLLYPAAGAVALLLTTPGLGLAADRTYNDLPAFTAVQIASGIDAVVTVGPAQSVAATAPNVADLDDIKIEVRDGTLKIWRDWDIFDLFGDMGDRQTRFTITAPKLDSADASSGADVAVSGLSGESVWLEASSGADLDATDIQATNVDVDVSSGADVTANGTCTKLEVDVSSGANANLENLVCSEAEAESSSGSDATIHVSSTLRAKASSGSDITVKGKPATTKIDESSGGTITIED